MNDTELVEWCKQNLSSQKKIIGPNWTRNNYEYLKNRWPDIWELLKNKKLKINKEFLIFLTNKYILFKLLYLLDKVGTVMCGFVI
jgi:hypothetical protein